MKKITLIITLCFGALSTICAGGPEWVRREVSELGILGKAFNTTNPYHRIDTLVYKGFTKSENRMCRSSAGLTVVFRTNARKIGVAYTPGEIDRGPFPSYRGFDLYIKKDGRWLWAGCTTFDRDHKDGNRVQTLVNNMEEGEKECLLYLPVNSEVNACQICVPEGYTVDAMPSPFRNKVVFHGSSFTHGISCSRGGMSYPMQFMRRTGLQVIPLGFSGRCLMQSYFADVIADIDADAYVFDAFSNPDIPTIRERTMPFIERMVKAHPGKPIIFQCTIYMERENFDTSAHKEFSGRRALADSIMTVACKKYKDVYYIKPDASLHNGESSTADGIHPNDNGYSLWEASIEKPLLKILRKYSIK